MIKVDVTWYDAYSHDCWQNTSDAVENCRQMMVCRTRGYLISESKDHIVICHTFNEADQVTGSLHIPRGCIKKIKIYEKS